MFKVYKNTSFIILILIIFFTNKAYSDVSYLNLNELMTKSIVGKYINETYEVEKKKIFKKFKENEQNLKKEEKEILTQKNILKKDEYQRKVESFQKKVKDYNSVRKENLQNLNNRRISATKKIIEILNPILTKYMKDNSISLILRKKDIIVAKKNLDITSDIVKLLDIEIQKINF